MRRVSVPVQTEEDSGNRLLAACSALERARVAPLLRSIELDAGYTLATAGESPTQILFPGAALISHVTEMQDGATVEVGMVGSEGISDLSVLFGDVTTSLSRTVVQVGGPAQAMRAADFRRCVVDVRGELFDRVNRYANAFLGCLALVAGCNTRHDTRQRVARWLLMVHDRVGRDEFALTHEYIASMMGVRRASVTLVMGALREAGAVEYAYGTMHVIDRAALEREACACYSDLRALFETAVS
ncbi:MAG TPA: Crp/Fnr family transcriptional regulator [Candidatus Baltobacteraceae bacterium]|nr:Crp/Fnr family transcriptional regulator [Candidatus Baltobacteraceae bacterium]